MTSTESGNHIGLLNEKPLHAALKAWYSEPGDVSELVSNELTGPFTTLELAEAMDVPRWLAQKAAYCLRAMGESEPVGKRGNAVLYADWLSGQ